MSDALFPVPFNADSDYKCMIMLEDSSNEEVVEPPKKHGGATVGKSTNLQRNLMEQERILREMYFVDNPLYDNASFARRFRVSRHIFNAVLADLIREKPAFRQKVNRAGKVGPSPLLKVTLMFCILAYGDCFDRSNENFGVSESTAHRLFHIFTKRMVEIYENQYLCLPNQTEVNRLMEQHAFRGFPGCIGSLDCTVFEWIGCPVGWKAQYSGPKSNKATIQLEAACGADLYLWHAYFGMPGASNNLNVLSASPLDHALQDGTFPPTRSRFRVCGTEFYHPYLLCDGIYPNSAFHMKAFANPVTQAQVKFTQLQESCRKDIERAFGILKIRFNILRHRLRYWTIEKVRNVVYCCVILHNMVIKMQPEDEDELRMDFLADEPENAAGNVARNNIGEHYGNDNTLSQIRDAVMEFQVKEGFHGSK